MSRYAEQHADAIWGVAPEPQTLACEACGHRAPEGVVTIQDVRGEYYTIACVDFAACDARLRAQLVQIDPEPLSADEAARLTF